MIELLVALLLLLGGQQAIFPDGRQTDAMIGPCLVVVLELAGLAPDVMVDCAETDGGGISS